MDKSPVLTVENVLCHLRQSRSNKKDILEIKKLLEHVEKHGCENKTQEYSIVDEIVQKVASTTEDANSVGCVIWLAYLQEQQKLPLLKESQFDKLFEWLFKQLQNNADNNEVVSRTCIALSGLIAIHPMNGNINFLDVFSVNKMGILKYLSCKNSACVIINVLLCLDNVLNALKDAQLTEQQKDVCAEAGRQILLIYYGDEKLDVDADNVSILSLHSLQILHKLIVLHPDFAKLHVAELLGLAKSYFHYGIDNVENSLEKPQKVFMSQQALYDSAEEIEVKINSEKARSCGGKTPKTRKPRAVAKNTRSTDYRNSGGYRSPDGKSGLVVAPSFDMRTSDSDVSEPENTTNRILYERNRRAKIRLASIALVGTIARLLERRILYGYWHALFPSGTAESKDNLLYIGQHDPNLRCRSAALQVCTNLLYGSKGFLHQAEVDAKRCPTTFIPFSVSLGFTLLAIYKSLITILVSESSLPVLTQALKCLAVLVQSTPFSQFKKGFVQDFVKHVKRFVYHRDVAIQVSALMVMEFLVATHETTLDIAESVGLPPKPGTVYNRTKGNNDEDIEIIDDEEFVEFEDNEDNKETKDNKETQNNEAVDSDKAKSENSSWLLLRILHNLGSKQDKPAAASSVRIESLQVLIAISSHFALLKPCLTQVSEVLQYSLNDPLPDVRVYAARCVDTCAFQINRYLLDKVACSTTEIKECQKFWLDILPIVVGHIRRDSEEMTTVRIALCDALSNVGVLMFEHLPQSSQISLLGFLSGVSCDSTDDTAVRAAAARALAVFALFPSLRNDLVFIENTAELTLHLVTDSNVLVRIKSFWSLGNISDALIGNTSDGPALTQETISNDLLFRLINAATVACSDNDKVRCNAVRTMGNLLGLLRAHHFHDEVSNMNWRQTFEKSVCRLTDCIRSSGNAKVKWNTCYAISNLMRNRTIFTVTDLNWQNTLYPALCHVIVHHSNFKVRINATSAITNIAERSHFGNYFEQFWSSMFEAIEQSYNLDNFHEYNHRDNLQEQLCLAVSHLVRCAGNEDLPMLKKHLLPHIEIIRNTWKRVINRIMPEKAAPLLSCPVVLLERGKLKDMLTLEQKNAIEFLMDTFAVE